MSCVSRHHIAEASKQHFSSRHRSDGLSKTTLQCLLRVGFSSRYPFCRKHSSETKKIHFKSQKMLK